MAKLDALRRKEQSLDLIQPQMQELMQIAKVRLATEGDEKTALSLVHIATAEDKVKRFKLDLEAAVRKAKEEEHALTLKREEEARQRIREEAKLRDLAREQAAKERAEEAAKAAHELALDALPRIFASQVAAQLRDIERGRERADLGLDVDTQQHRSTVESDAVKHEHERARNITADIAAESAKALRDLLKGEHARMSTLVEGVQGDVARLAATLASRMDDESPSIPDPTVRA